MNESQLPVEAPAPKPWFRRELFLFIVGSVLIAFLLVVVSMAIYTSSGASLLDASKPGFKSIQSEVDQTDTFEAFSADGTVSKSTLDQFQQLYDKQVKSVTSSSDYDTTPLQDQTLGIDELPPTSE